MHMEYRPEEMKISNLLPDEQVVMVMRRHWIALVYIFLYFLFLVITVALIVAFGSSIAYVGPYVNIMLTIYISIFALFIYVSWMRYELDLYIITTKRIIGLDEVTFLNRHVSECLLDKVQEVNGRTTGLLSNLLNY